MANIPTTETQGKPEFAHGTVFSDKENLLRAAAGDKSLTRIDLAVLVNVLYHLNRTHGFARPQCATLALECDADERSIGRSINKLHDAGYMRAERRRGGMKRGYQFYPSFAKGAGFAAELSAKFAAAMRDDEVDENVASTLGENVASTNSRPDTLVASTMPNPTNPSQKVDENVAYNPSTDPTERRGSGKGDASAPTGLSLSLQPVRDVASQKAVKADCRDALKDLYASWPTYISPPDVDKALSKALAGGDSLDDIRAAMADYSVLYADRDCRSKTSLAKWIAERRYVVPTRRNVAAPVQPAKVIRQEGQEAVPTSAATAEVLTERYGFKLGDVVWVDDGEPRFYGIVKDITTDAEIEADPSVAGTLFIVFPHGSAGSFSASQLHHADMSLEEAEAHNAAATAERLAEAAEIVAMLPFKEGDTVRKRQIGTKLLVKLFQIDGGYAQVVDGTRWSRVPLTDLMSLEDSDRLGASWRVLEEARREAEAAERARKAEEARQAAEAEERYTAETNKQRWAEVLRTNGEKLAAIRRRAALEVYEVEAEGEFDAERLIALEDGTLDIPVLDSAAMKTAYKAAVQAIQTAEACIARRLA